jgi:two-component system response regulator GlrR
VPATLLLAQVRLAAETNRESGTTLPRDPRLARLIGNSPSFLGLLDVLPLYAASTASVLVLGSTGTGKEELAQAIHYLSRRAAGPWVAVNCGAIPSELFEAEVFGHVRGAFTGATLSRTGLLREADGGTLFLDEVDTLTLASQVKLLRFLQEREFRQVGSNSLQRVDVRVIAASNCSLADKVRAGAFRRDLYYRLNVLSLRLPLLRDRREDIVPLALHFLADQAARSGRALSGLTPNALAALLAHDWPGNVRELQHVMERAAVVAAGAPIRREHLQLDEADHLEAPSMQAAKRALIVDFEKNYVEGLLRACAGNITHAADAAGKNRRAFWQLIRKYRIEPGRFRGAGHPET